MRIGFYRYSLFNRGGDRLSLEYANFLSRGGHDVSLYVSQLETAFEIAPTINLCRLKPQTKASFLMHTASCSLKDDLVIVDIIHLAALLSRHNKVVYYAQADDVEYYKNPLMRRLISGMYQHESSSGRAIISMSQHLTDILSGRYAFAKVITLNTGIDHSMFFLEEDPALIALKEGRKAVIFMVRGDTFRKGIDLGERVIAKIAESLPGKMEVWACGESFAPKIPGLLVRNFGTVTDARLRQILSSADIFLYPSRHEGFGLFPLEAMACGTIAVVSEAIPYAQSIDCILSTPIEDVDEMERALTKLVVDDDFYLSMRAQVRDIAKAYDFEQTKIQFEAALTAIHGEYQ